MILEHEVKYRVGRVVDLRKKLKMLKFLCNKTKAQEDRYYSPPHKNFIGTGKYYLRLRKDGKKGKFAYHVVRSNVTTEEREVGVDDFNEMDKLLKKLDFKLDCVVFKKRCIYRSIQFPNIEIVVDNVKRLGYFIEIEYQGNLNKKIKDQFNDLINSLDLNQDDIISGIGYPDLITNLK